MASITAPWSSSSGGRRRIARRTVQFGTGMALVSTGSREPDRPSLLAELFGADAVPDRLRGRLLRTREVAALFQVSERTVAAWARRGRIPSVRTPGGHRLYPAEEIRRLLAAAGEGATDTDD